MARLSAYLVDIEGCAPKGTFYDCIYDFSPLGFEKNITNNVKRVEVRTLLKKLTLEKEVRLTPHLSVNFCLMISNGN